MNIVKISIAVAILGIIALLFLVKYNEQNITKISDLKMGQIERITGMVNSIYISKDGHAFLKVADTTGEISVVAFKSSNIDEVFEIEVGDKISVLGRVEEYKGKLEIIAKEIKRI
ncbi:MAG: OB-fold nucleic acid binding domain-containing protein [Candidatus Aenigmatarchaeota archaeon]